MRTPFVILAAGAAVVAASPAAAQTPAFNQVVETRIQPQNERLLKDLVREGRGLAIDGTPVFNGSDKFLPGKIALGLGNYIADLPEGDPRLAGYLGDFRTIAKMTVDDPNDSWGIYYYLSALNRLRETGRLQKAVDPLTLAKLRVRLDWRSFVDVDSLQLIDHPTNYYGVAFAIARLRASMGWDQPEHADRLLERLSEHYRKHSGPYGFSDETDGEGRFDRYSVLLAGEIAERYLESGGAPPEEVRGWLRNSAAVMLMRVNPHGEGFEYGRSLGPYSETAMVEVLTAAAALDLLSPAEKDLAYAFASRTAQRYVEFWTDPRTGSVNLWDGGRRTDAYRGKFRILGENLSLGHQFVSTNRLWNRMGYRDRTPPANWALALSRLPKRQVTWFARGEYDRLLLTLRDKGLVIGLPLINGGRSQHMNSPYYPIPYANRLVAGVADQTLPQLTPQFTARDGSVLMPLAYIRNAKVSEQGTRTVVTYDLAAMDRLGGAAPVQDGRIRGRTTYVFEPGRITRTDVYEAAAPIDLKDVVLEFASFGELASAGGERFTYKAGPAKSFSAKGLQHCQGQSTGGDRRYQSPNGPMKSVVTCRSGDLTLKDPLTISWTLTYG